jgi:hypothetical protein
VYRRCKTGRIGGIPLSGLFYFGGKEGMAGNISSQAPSPKLEIHSPGNPEKAKYTFVINSAEEGEHELISYNFSEAVNDLKGSFRFSIEDKKGQRPGEYTIFDIIKVRDIVKIYEGEDTPRFWGIIRKKQIGVTMTSQGPRRTRIFTGDSLQNILAEFILSMDIKIMNAKDAGTENTKLTIELIGTRTIQEYLQKVTDAYLKLSTGAGVVASTESVDILKQFTGNSELTGIFKDGSPDHRFSYDIGNAWYSQGQNSLGQLWKNILPEPVYEMYAFCDREDNKPKIMARVVPFGTSSDGGPWANLHVTEIDPLDLTGYDLSQSDEEVYTIFASYLEGSAMSHDFYTVISQYEKGVDSTIKYDSDKFGRYGYKPLEITFRGYNREKKNEKDEPGNLNKKFSELNDLAKGWYSRLPDMYSGTMTVITNFNEPDKNPRTGEKLLFLDGEFYINAVSHSWTYGGAPLIRLQVSRGMKYEESGLMVSGEGGELV